MLKDAGDDDFALVVRTLKLVGAPPRLGSLGADFQLRTRDVQPQMRKLKPCDCESKHFKAILYSGNGCGKCVDFVRISSDSHEHRYILK